MDGCPTGHAGEWGSRVRRVSEPPPCVGRGRSVPPLARRRGAAPASPGDRTDRPAQAANRSDQPRPAQTADQSGQPRQPADPANPAQPARAVGRSDQPLPSQRKGWFLAGFDGKPPSLGAHEGKPAKGEWVDQGILLIGAAGSSKEAESLSVKGSFPSKPARNSYCLCQARIDRGRVGPPRAERPGASEAPDPSGGALRGARPEGSGSELEEHGFVSALVWQRCPRRAPPTGSKGRQPSHGGRAPVARDGAPCGRSLCAGRDGGAGDGGRGGGGRERGREPLPPLPALGLS